MKKTKMLKKNYEFKAIFNKSQISGGKYLVAFIKKNKNQQNFLGIAIGVKIAKAVHRNHLKRLIRESYNAIEQDIENGYSIIFTWKKGIDFKNAKFADIKKDMEKVLKKARVLNFKNEEK